MGLAWPVHLGRGSMVSPQLDGAKWLHSAYFLDDSSQEAVGNHVCAGAG